jgi:hypothetical protein
MGTYQEEAPKGTPIYHWIKKWGTDDVFAAAEAALDYGMDFDLTINATHEPKAKAHFFAGGSAYVEAWKLRIPIVEAYAKAEGALDWKMCRGMLKRDKKTWTQHEKESNQVKLGAYASVLTVKYMIGFKSDLCAGGDPCIPEQAKDPNLLHDFGDFTLFKHRQNFMAGPVPVSLEFGCLIGLKVKFAVEGRLGIPGVLKYEKRMFEKELKRDDRPRKESFMFVGEVRPIMAGKVYGEACLDVGLAKVGLGLQITVIHIEMPFDVGYNFHTTKVCIGARMILSALAGEFYAVVEITMLPKFEVLIFKWEGLKPIVIDIYVTGCCHDSCRPTCVGGICDRTSGKTCIPPWT